MWGRESSRRRQRRVVLMDWLLLFCMTTIRTTRSSAFVPTSLPTNSLGSDISRWTSVGGNEISIEQLAKAKSPKTKREDKQKKNKKRKPRTSSSSSSVKSHLNTQEPQTWRIFGIQVHPDLLGNDGSTKHKRSNSAELAPEKRALAPAVLQALWSRLKVTDANTNDNGNSPCWPMGIQDVRVVRKSLDARLHKRRSDGTFGPRYDYVVDVDLIPASFMSSTKEGDTQISNKGVLRHQPGRMECLSMSSTKDNQSATPWEIDTDSTKAKDPHKRVIVIGAGPAGLFCALQLAHAGIQPIVLERGQPVESRGKDIGALMHRRSLDSESNFCFGEGGAGTWSDGKLTTRIGRNSQAVRFVLETLVQYGAPAEILVEGAPHLGTDNLVRLLRNMRNDLRRMGGEIHFGTKVTDLIVSDGVTKGVCVECNPVAERHAEKNTLPALLDPSSDKPQVFADAVVLATGHSARDMYERLHALGVQLEPKGFAVGFRVEHPQKLINKIQYGNEWGPTVVTGKTKTDVENSHYFESGQGVDEDRLASHISHLPVPSYRLATDKAFDGDRCRGVYSFCMCPGGQIVPASTDPDEVCVNGMSFSRRDSRWANSALVVTVSPDDEVLDPYREAHGVLAGLAFQRDMERRASQMGGGSLHVPVQRLTDFLDQKASTSAPPSSYRLGVVPAACHEIYPPGLVASIRDALSQFEKQMPGYISDEGLLHAVETRTSSPVRVSRDRETMQAIGTQLLFPSGEGAGFAGGIVSAAVDGMAVAEAVCSALLQGGTSPDEFQNDSGIYRKSVGTFY